jgi:hypothetical protein
MEDVIGSNSRAQSSKEDHGAMNRSLVPPELLDPVVAYFAPQRAILFGSAARGDAGSDSDIDLLVVVDDDTPAEKVTLAALRGAADLSARGRRDPDPWFDLRTEAADRRLARRDGGRRRDRRH